MSDMHWRQPGFSYSASGPFTKKTERIPQFKETGDSWYISENELDKSCVPHDMAYGDFKDLTRRTASDKILRDKAFNIAKNPNMININVDFLQWFISFLAKKTSGGTVKNEIMYNEELAEKLHKLIIRTFKKRKLTHVL